MRYVLSEVEFERLCQDRTWGGEQHDNIHSQWDWVALITRHTGLAVDDGNESDNDRFRKQMIRVAALAVAAVEAHDRKYGIEINQKHRGSGV